MTITVLNPRETAIFENEQKSRIAPDSVVTGVQSSEGLDAHITLSPDGVDTLDANINVFNLAGGAFGSLPFIDDQAVVDNGAYTLENDGVLTVAAQLAIVLIDVDDSITNYAVTIVGLDAGAGALNEVFTFTGAGKVMFSTGLFKSITCITGGVITDTGSHVGDDLRVLARTGPLASDVVGRMHDSLMANNSNRGDPNGNQGNGGFIEATEITDEKALLTMPDLPPEVISIQSVDLRWTTKVLGAGSAGIDYVLKHSGVEYIVGNNSVNITDTAIPTDSGLLTFGIAPGTGLPWTPAQVDTIQLGVIFKGDNPAIEKKWLRIRMEVDCRLEPFGTTEPDIFDAVIEAITSASLFDEGVANDSKYLVDMDGQTTRRTFGYPSLPSDAIGLLNVRCFWRSSHESTAHPNGVGVSSYPCAIGGLDSAGTPSTQPRGGSGQHYGRGPLEQSNLGGNRFSADSTSGSFTLFGDENGRVLWQGVPAGSCHPAGASFEQEGRNLGWGTPLNFETTLATTPGIGNPWTVAAFVGMNTGFEVGGRGGERRHWYKTYVEPEWQRGPTGDSFLHLVLRDASDATHMTSQHPDDKQLGCNFPGIDEATEVNSISGIVRAQTAIGATRGWVIILQVGGIQYADPSATEHMNTDIQDKTAIWTEHPTELRPWTRDEVNSAILIFEAKGENDYFPKTVYNMKLSVDFLGIPDKIDTARRLGSEVLLFQGQPVPMLQLRTPFVLGDAKLVQDVSVTHDSVPSVVKTLGLEKWERALFRLFEKELDPETDTWVQRLYDLRDFLVTFVASFQAVTKGRSFDGMSLITPGANMQFVRGSNDYQEDPFADLIQELQANEPPTNQDGILVQNQGINRIVNSAFSEGAVDVFDGWTKVGLPAAGASIVEDPNDVAYDEETGIMRSVIMTGADTPADIYLERDVTLPTGESLVPEGGRHVLTITHKDDSGFPISVWCRGKPVGFSEENLDQSDDSWVSSNRDWHTFPVRSVRTRDRIQVPFATLHDQSQSVGNRDEYTFALRIGVRTSANQINHLYDANTDGGTILSGGELMYPRSRILSRTGPVVRDPAGLFVANQLNTPMYYLKRGTGFCVIETLWDTAELPVATGVKRYVFGMVINGTNQESLYYDCDSETFVYERVIAGVTFTATKVKRGIGKNIPIRIAWRWISFEGDLGENPFSIQLYIDDERGTDGAPTSSPAQPNSADFYIGSLDGTNGQMLDGRIRRMRITQQALSLDRIKKLR